MLMSWRHSGFNVFYGPRIYPPDEEAMENLARYIIRASFSQERMTMFHKSPRSSTNLRMEKTNGALSPWRCMRLLFASKNQHPLKVKPLIANCI